jgi:hypothetical protein
VRIKIEGLKVQFFIDENSPCCGESRTDWRKVGEIGLERLVKGLQDVVTGKSKIVRLDA